jgi:hypothetical protein
MGTRASGGIEEVTGAAVATLAGVAGIVWKQGDRYYLRGVPVAENGTSIQLRPAPKEGYVRRPFLLLDAFVARTDEGNHVLLEPDETTDAYNVRRVSLDPATGAIDWDPNVSFGSFSLPVSAAALHASGRVVAIHTDSGRLGVLRCPWPRRAPTLTWRWTAPARSTCSTTLATALNRSTTTWMSTLRRGCRL